MIFLRLWVILCLTMLTALTLQAQVGDPIFKEDFGSGTPQIGPEINDPDFYTTYTYVPSTPNDGNYTIANSTLGMYTGAWLVTGDHTGTPGGYMMVAGANGSPDVFYKRTVKGLCPNTQYQFSAYLLNLMQFDGIKPNVTFKVTTSQGTSTKNTGLIDNGLGWQQYSITFTTPPTGGDITLQMTNSSTSGYGNDIALDDITFSPYGPALKTGLNNSSTALSSCSAADNTYQLSVGIDPSGFQYTNPAYQWQVSNGTDWIDIPGATSPAYQLRQPSVAGVYQYRAVSAEAVNITSAQCRVASVPVTLTIKPTPVAQASVSGSSTICYGDNINLNASGGDTYDWTGPNGFTNSQQNPVINTASETMTGQYQVKVTTAGCPAWATVAIHVNPQVTVAAGPGKDIIHGQSVQLSGMVTGEGITYHWTPSRYLSNPDILNPIATPEADITYTLHVTSAAPCFMELESPVTISVYDKIVVPNTFSPNNDGINDTWKIAALDTFPNSVTQVFSRYGTVVFESKGYPQPWDGSTKSGKLPTGTYFYRIDLKNGKVYSGWVLLVD